MGDTKTLPHNVTIRLNVGDVHIPTSLNTVMEGARFGYGYFQILCVKILQETPDIITEPVWTRVNLVPTEMDQNRGEHFIHGLLVLTEILPHTEGGQTNGDVCGDRVVSASGLGTRRLEETAQAKQSWTSSAPGSVLHGARLYGQDLSILGFGRCCLRHADLRPGTSVSATLGTRLWRMSYRLLWS